MVSWFSPRFRLILNDTGNSGDQGATQTVFLEGGKVLYGNQFDCVQPHALDRIAERVELNAFVAPFTNRVVDVLLNRTAAMGWSGLAGYGFGRRDNGGFFGHGLQSGSSGNGVSHSSVGVKN